MNETLRKILSSLGSFFSIRRNCFITCIALICLIALVDFIHSGLVRRTFVFYSYIEGKLFVEERMLNRASDRETDIKRYSEEVLLGPASPALALLFPRDTMLNSFMLRDGVAYLDLSEPAALPIPEGRNVFQSLLTLNEGIRRNFPMVRDVRLFIGGNEVFFEEFRKIFANSADNTRTAP